MARFEVRVHRKQVAYRIMLVEGANPEAARRRALAIVRHERGAGPEVPLSDLEHDGEWCDDSYGRPVVDSVEFESATTCPHGRGFGQLCEDCGHRVTGADIERSRP